MAGIVLSVRRAAEPVPDDDAVRTARIVQPMSEPFYIHTAIVPIMNAKHILAMAVTAVCILALASSAGGSDASADAGTAPIAVPPTLIEPASPGSFVEDITDTSKEYYVASDIMLNPGQSGDITIYLVGTGSITNGEDATGEVTVKLASDGDAKSAPTRCYSGLALAASPGHIYCAVLPSQGDDAHIRSTVAAPDGFGVRVYDGNGYFHYPAGADAVADLSALFSTVTVIDGGRVTVNGMSSGEARNVLILEDVKSDTGALVLGGAGGSLVFNGSSISNDPSKGDPKAHVAVSLGSADMQPVPDEAALAKADYDMAMCGSTGYSSIEALLESGAEGDIHVFGTHIAGEDISLTDGRCMTVHGGSSCTGTVKAAGASVSLTAAGGVSILSEDGSAVLYGSLTGIMTVSGPADAGYISENLAVAATGQLFVCEDGVLTVQFGSALDIASPADGGAPVIVEGRIVFEDGSDIKAGGELLVNGTMEASDLVLDDYDLVRIIGELNIEDGCALTVSGYYLFLGEKALSLGHKTSGKVTGTVLFESRGAVFAYAGASTEGVGTASTTYFINGTAYATICTGSDGPAIESVSYPDRGISLEGLVIPTDESGNVAIQWYSSPDLSGDAVNFEKVGQAPSVYASLEKPSANSDSMYYIAAVVVIAVIAAIAGFKLLKH